MKFSLKRKSIFLIFLISFIVAGVAAGISYRTYSQTMDARYKANAMDIAKTAAALSDPEKVQSYARQVLAIYQQDPAPEFSSDGQEQAYYQQYAPIQQDPYYAELYNTLQSVKTNNRDVLYLYLFVLDEDSRTGIYLIDADDSENACPMGTWDVIYPQNYAVFDDPAQGFPAYISHSDFGWLCSAGAPVLADDGTVAAYAMVDISMDEVMADRAMFLRNLILGGLAATVALTLLSMPDDQQNRGTAHQSACLGYLRFPAEPGPAQGREQHFPAEHPHRRRDRKSGPVHPAHGAGHQPVHFQPGRHHGGEGTDRGGIERCHPDPGRYAAQHLPRLSHPP